MSRDITFEYHFQEGGVALFVAVGLETPVQKDLSISSLLALSESIWQTDVHCLETLKTHFSEVIGH